MKDDRRSRPRTLAGVLLVLCAPFGIAFQAGPDLHTLRVESALVTVPVMVSDAQGRFIPGLDAGFFRLYQDGLPQPIKLFLTSEDPIRIAMLLDTSPSTVTVLNNIRKAAARFLLEMRPTDLAMVASVDSEIKILCSFTSDAGELSRAINRAQGGGTSTRIRDALLEIVQKRLHAIPGRKAIILLTDGEDHGSEIPPADLLNVIAGSSTMIYSVFYPVDPRQLMKELVRSSSAIPKSARVRETGRPDPWKQREEQAAEFLRQISEISAGRFYRSDVSELNKAFKQISDELRSQYLLGFYPDRSKLDGQTHSLDVQVAIPGVSVRSRRSYKAVRD